MAPEGHPPLRLSRATDAVAALFVALFAVWLCWPGQTRATRELLDMLFFLPPGLATGWMSLRASRSSRHDRATRRAWLFIGLSQLSYWASGAVWSALIWYRPGIPSSNWTESLNLPSYPLALAGVLSFPGLSGPRSSRLRFGLDLLLILIGCALGVWFFGLRPAWDGSGYVALTYSAIDFGLLLVLGIGLLRAVDPITREAIGWLLASRAAKLAATVWYTRLKAGSGYYLGHWVDACWFLSWVFAFVAARRVLHALARGESTAERPQRDYQGGALPYLFVLLGQVLLLWLLRGELGSPAGVAAIATSILSALIIARQMAELSEHARLFELDREREASFRSLVQHGSDLTLVVDSSGALLYFSPSAEELFRDQPPGRATLAALLDAAGAAALRALLEGLSPGSAKGPLPARLRRPDGSELHVELMANDLRHEKAVGGIVLTGRDVSDRRALEAELLQAQTMRALGQMAGSAAHDFNNILTVLSAHVQFLLEELPEDSPLRGEVLEIANAASRAAAVTRQLLQFSRRDAVCPTSLELGAVLARLEPILRQLISSGIETRLEVAPEPAFVLIDRAQLEQAILNLAMNARDAMPAGGVLRIRSGKRVAPAGQFATLEIADTGEGLDEAARARVFEPFFTAKATGARGGLELASAYGIVTNAGGQLTVDSAPGRGSTFTVLLPWRPPPPAAQAAP